MVTGSSAGSHPTLWLPGLGPRVVPASPAGAVVCVSCDTTEAWSAAISGHFVVLAASVLESGAAGPGVQGRLEQVQRDAVSITRVSGSAQRVQRRARDIRTGRGGRVFLNLQIEGEGLVEGAAGALRTTVGSAALVPSDVPFDMRFPRNFVQLCVDMDEQWLMHRLSRSVRAPGGPPLHLGHGMGRVVHAALDALLGAAPGPGAADCEDLFALALDHALGARDRAGPGVDKRVERLRALLRVHGTDPAFGVEEAAAALQCSVRTLHTACHQQGSTFGRMLLAARLDRAAALLAQRGGGGARVSAVGFQCGFADLSHFSRTFRARFGCPPSQWVG